ncbi:MAG: NADP-dependent malic enzyme [Candidatus Accumulibacter phosphatis]|uniref:NADP-dependent malic enzyme n=2 Tax=Candidatus Accumulibacter TaxID=327159 RepID=A0A080M8G7_9PROT|nr:MULTISPECIES: NADP-dependent malic enzyme [Candidatus Accumulibacter]KFB76770.1 MAG: NADP-dependent malic enzyme [Candidatus Accumulibacter cognatus]MBL8400026.1 NADP-dependent malic enzyme [Accumulibacter sp.]MBN8518244.1 NADP-dependent malic enzyme [Accumulibacter sp.]MBO3709438.1 NADP-dependent malic enzyme [Accumulibacter sp.]MCC2868769.1 NADP-dependent malic enzyme [Candidatus Accumulibacter phosphatis]
MENNPGQAGPREAALEYHRYPTPGKIAVQPTKGLSNQLDLALAYSPGVAHACHAIVDDPAAVSLYTSRSNLVGVITNGTAVLGLGNIGPLAAKPVMEGKGCLFKKFAGIDVFDIELSESDPDKLIDLIAAMEPTLGGINLEDIKAPECFYIEARLKERMSIPVFHDDQHGTAIISSAAILNALKVAGKAIDEVKVVCSGAGAAAISCLNLWCELGVRRENVTVCDSKGVIYTGRDDNMEPTKAVYARTTEARTLYEAIDGADVFLGLSAAGALEPEMLARMAKQPIVFALANPIPEIMPELARQVRPDVIIATGRSDFANQVNNVLCFPFIFRGALDVGATCINEHMKMACVKALAAMAEEEVSAEVAMAYPGEELAFGPDYLIPKPFDPRLITIIAPAVAQAAMDSGVATRPIADMPAYREKLKEFVYQTGVGMRAVFSAAKRGRRTRIVYPDGEDERLLRAVQIILDEGLTRPILIGRPGVIVTRLERIGSRLRVGTDFDVVDPNSDHRYKECWTAYHQLRKRQGVTIDIAKTRLRSDNTIIGAMLLRLGYADGMICGLTGRFLHHLRQVDEIIGKAPGCKTMAAMAHLLLPGRAMFICDTHVNENPDAEQLAEIAFMAVEEVRRFKIRPKLAMLSHSNFGSSQTVSARKVAEAVAIVRAKAPDLEVDGEMRGDSALSAEIRKQFDPQSPLTGEANVLVMPNLDAANISFNLLKMIGSDGMAVGPILLGAARPVHVLGPTSTVRRVVNMTALVVVDAASK